MSRLTALLCASALALAPLSASAQSTGQPIGLPVSVANGGSGVANTGNLTWNAAQTFSFTSGQTMTFPAATATLAGLGTAQTFTAADRFSGGFALGAADGASPVAQTFAVQNVVTGTSNTAGVNTTMAGSQGTGTGKGGSWIFQTSPPGTTGTAVNAEQAVLTVDGNAHISSGGVAPAVSSCGTGSPSVAGNDTSGAITIGTTATACTLTFKIAYAAAPVCVLSDKTTMANLTSFTVSTSAIVLTMTSNSGNVINYICLGA